MRKKYTPGGCGCCTPDCEPVPVTSWSITTGTAQGGTSTTIQLAAAETFNDDDLNNQKVEITGGKGIGQVRTISDYTGATDTATVSSAWTTTPDITSDYKVYTEPNAGGQVNWSNGTLTPEQIITTEYDGYSIRFQTDKTVSVDIEGFTIDIDTANQTVSLDGNTETVTDPTDGADDALDVAIYVCPNFIYVAVFNNVTALDDSSYMTPINAPFAYYSGTCLTADFTTPPYSIVPTFTISTTETDVTIDRYEDVSGDITFYPEHIVYDCDAYFYNCEVDTDCRRGMVPVCRHYGHLNNLNSSTLGHSGFDLTEWGKPDSSAVRIWTGDDNSSGTDSGDIHSRDSASPGTRLRSHIESIPQIDEAECLSMLGYRAWWWNDGGTPTTVFVNTPGGGFSGLNILWTANFVWTLAESTGEEPYPKPKYIAYQKLSSSTGCWFQNASTLQPTFLNGTNIGMTETATVDVAINDVTAGFTLGVTGTYDANTCPATVGGQNCYIEPLYNDGLPTADDPGGDSVTATWTV